VIYTSGSTGAPKGVMVEHRNVVNELLFQEVQYGSPAGQTILQFSPAAFDAAVEEILNLALGATLILGTETQVTSLDGFSALCVTHEVSRVALPVRFWEQLVRHGVVPASLRCVIIGGEAARGQSVRAWFDLGKPGTELFNAYGPTETTICAARYRCNSRDCGPPPIGRPITNGRIYLLDEYLEPAPVGVTGEIYIAGAGVARGYINKPALTAERFSADPFGAPGTRMYRTGDLGRYLPDGNIEYLGRNDFQVKIRGFRIELGEIEAKLQEHIGVCEAVVIAREEQGDKRLVAYYRRQGDVAPGVESLRSHLQWQLPEYMVPAAYVEMEQWPVTSNGKLDRKALPAPEGEAFLVQTYEPPEGETEQTLSQIWSELLGVERVGRQDNFFELGGHSLLAVSVIERMRQAGLQADVRSLFETPTLTALASATKLFKEVEL
jgi:non-ribosomal peptide synthetase component F